MRSRHSWTQQIICTVIIQQHVNNGIKAHIQNTITLLFLYYIRLDLSLAVSHSDSDSEVNTMWAAGHWCVFSFLLLATWTIFLHPRRLPPLLLLSRANSFSPLSSSGSNQIALLSLHLIWQVSTKISSPSLPLMSRTQIHTHRSVLFSASKW